MSSKVVEETNNSATQELLELLSTEIARDGGASLVTSLKDYVGYAPKRFNAKLVEAIGRPKLLSFLERHENIFLVNRHSTPHFVVLKTESFVNFESIEKQNPALVDALRRKLLDKALYTLRRRQAKLDRRKENLNLDQSGPCEYVSTFWLLQSCIWPMHYYLRAENFYRVTYTEDVEVHQVGSEAWLEMVQAKFVDVLAESQDIEWNQKTGKALLKTDSGWRENEHDYAKRLGELVCQLVAHDGGHQVPMKLLLSRHEPLKAFLGGRDFWKLTQLYPECFVDVSIWEEHLEDSSVDIVLRSKQGILESGRLKVDEVGLYSVTNSKWGAAVANIMIKACRNEGFLFESKSNYLVAVDLTASVGGMTLALAKSDVFAKVIAVEIDKHRSELCRQNMKRHEVQVQVINDDAISVIPKLCGEACCIVIDPPWGGANYKQNKQPLRMGPWLLDDVLAFVSIHLKPCLVGLRLPVNFELKQFLASLESKGVRHNVVIIRKLSVQLFVVVHLI